MTRMLITIAGFGLAVVASAQEPTQRGSNNSQFIDEELEAVVGRGLDFLASTQQQDGSWHQHVGYKLNTDYQVQEANVAHVGVSSLALMSFLAGGHMPGRGKYGEVLTRGLDYVLSTQQETGFLEDHGTRMYSHAFATLFLAEIYGMTRRSDVRRALERSVNLIVDSQNAQGGWRYRPFARESDMSITVCQVLALRSARNVGIYVPYSTIREAQNYVYLSAVSGDNKRYHGYRSYPGYGGDGGSFKYQLRTNSRATFPLTAAGITTLYAAGEYDNPVIRDALDYLNRQLQAFNEDWQGHYFFYYGHYYAVQAYYIAGGRHWNTYFREMKRRLLRTQERDGSWACYTGPGDVFATAVCTLVLQIPYQYLPIFQR